MTENDGWCAQQGRSGDKQVEAGSLASCGEMSCAAGELLLGCLSLGPAWTWLHGLCWLDSLKRHTAACQACLRRVHPLAIHWSVLLRSKEVSVRCPLAITLAIHACLDLHSAIWQQGSGSSSCGSATTQASNPDTSVPCRQTAGTLPSSRRPGSRWR